MLSFKAQTLLLLSVPKYITRLYVFAKRNPLQVFIFQDTFEFNSLVFLWLYLTHIYYQF